MQPMINNCQRNENIEDNHCLVGAFFIEAVDVSITCEVWVGSFA
jgi:hypothetical protein